MAVSGEGKGRGLLLFSSFWCSTERGSARGSSFTSSGPNWVGRWGGVVVSATEAVGWVLEVDEVLPGMGDVLDEQPAVAESALVVVVVVEVSIFCCCGCDCPCEGILLGLAMEV